MSSFVQPSKPPKLFIGYQISQKKQEMLDIFVLKKKVWNAWLIQAEFGL